MAFSLLSPPDISNTIIHTSFESVQRRSLSFMCYKPLLFLKMLINQCYDVLKEWWGTQWHLLRLQHDNGDGASSQHGGRVLRCQDSPQLQAQHGGIYGQCVNKKNKPLNIIHYIWYAGFGSCKLFVLCTRITEIALDLVRSLATDNKTGSPLSLFDYLIIIIIFL